MEDSIIIVGAYTDSDEKKKYLNDLLSQLKKTGIEVVLVSHLPVSEDVQGEVAYYLYDSKNILLTPQQSTYWWLRTDSFYVITKGFNISSHAYAVVKSMQQAVYFMRSIGKKFFYYLEYDCSIPDEDLHLFQDLRSRIIGEGKKGYVQTFDVNPRSNRMDGVSNLFFAFDIDFYCSKLPYFPDVNSYVERSRFHNMTDSTTAEQFLYGELRSYMDDLISEEAPTAKVVYFPHCKSDLCGYEGGDLTRFDVVPEMHSLRPVLIGFNSNVHRVSYRVVMKDSEGEIVSEDTEVNMVSKGWFFKYLKREVETVEVYALHREGELVCTRSVKDRLASAEVEENYIEFTNGGVH